MIKYFFKQYWRYIAMALAFASITFLSNSCEVHAESISDYRMSVDLYYRIGNSGSFSSANSRYTNFQTSSQGQTLQLQIYGWLQSDVSMAQQVVGTPNVWGRWTICADRDSFTEGYNVQNTTNVTFINTSIPCKLANAPNYSNAYITFATFKSTNVQNVTQQNYGDNGKITFDIPNNAIASTFLINSSWTILAFELSFNQFPTYSQDSAVFDKLDTMISAINTLISQSNNSNVVSAINGTTNAINGTTNAINNQSQQQHNDAVSQKQSTDAINNSLNDSDTSNVSLDVLTGQTIDTGVISGLMLIPINLVNSMIQAFNGTCHSYEIGDLFGTTLVLPCINLESFLGTPLWNTIDIIITGVFIFGMSKLFMRLFNKLMRLQDIWFGGVDFCD